MIKTEYNRDVKRLRKAVRVVGCYVMSDSLENELKNEFMRLYRADETFEYANKESVLTLLRLNIRFRWIPLFQFGMKINL